MRGGPSLARRQALLAGPVARAHTVAGRAPIPDEQHACDLQASLAYSTAACKRPAFGAASVASSCIARLANLKKQCRHHGNTQRTPQQLEPANMGRRPSQSHCRPRQPGAPNLRAQLLEAQPHPRYSKSACQLPPSSCRLASSSALAQYAV
jgi:hypothetical protein